MKRAGQKRKAQHEDDMPIKKARKVEDAIQAMGQYDDDNFVDSDRDLDDNNNGYSDEDNMDSGDGNNFENDDDDDGDQFDDEDMPELADISNGKL